MSFNSNNPFLNNKTFSSTAVSKKDEVQAFAAKVKEVTTPDVLVNNTGIVLPGAIHNEPEGNFEFMMNTNLFSAYYLIREFVGAMIQRKSGHVFSMGSIAGLTAYPNGGSYAVSKWAMLGMTKCLREELKPHQLKVTSIFLSNSLKILTYSTLQTIIFLY